jgi:hypothetical protein
MVDGGESSGECRCPQKLGLSRRFTCHVESSIRSPPQPYSISNPPGVRAWKENILSFEWRPRSRLLSFGAAFRSANRRESVLRV